jgi:branched-chain amino acid transport system substrate-binding protein
MKRTFCISLLSSVLLLFSTTLVCAQAPKEILIGGTISVTGRFSTIVGPFKKLAEAWEKQVNDRGGIFVKGYNEKLPIHFIIYDDASDQANSQKFYEKLITDDKVHILIGPFGSFLSFAASTVAEKYKMPMVMVCASDKRLFERGYKYSVSQLDYADYEAYAYLEMLKKEGKIKKIAMLSEDTLHSTGVLKASVAKAKEYDFDVILNETLPADTKDFSALITKIKGLDPDVAFCEGFPSFEIPFMKQAMELGLRPKEFYNGHLTKPVIDALGPMSNNIAGGAYWVPGFKFPGKEDYLSVLKTTGITWDGYMESAIRFFSYQALQNAIETAGSLNPEKLMEALRKQKFVSISGPISHKPDGSGTIIPLPIQIHEGKFVSIYPANVADGKHLFPTLWK